MESTAQIEDKSNSKAVAAAPSHPVRWAIIVGLGVSILCAGAFMLGARGELSAFAASESAGPAATIANRYVELPDIVANLSGGSAPRFVKVRVTLRTVQGQADIVREHAREIQDMYVSYLHALHPDEYYGAAGFERLRAGLRLRTELALGENAAALDDVLIVEFVRQ